MAPVGPDGPVLEDLGSCLIHRSIASRCYRHSGTRCGAQPRGSSMCLERLHQELQPLLRLLHHFALTLITEFSRSAARADGCISEQASEAGMDAAGAKRGVPRRKSAFRDSRRIPLRRRAERELRGSGQQGERSLTRPAAFPRGFQGRPSAGRPCGWQRRPDGDGSPLPYGWGLLTATVPRTEPQPSAHDNTALHPRPIGAEIRQPRA